MFNLDTVTLKSTQTPKTISPNKAEWKAYFENTWELYEILFSSITGEDALYEAPDPLRHPLIFYYGHTAVFYINKFKMAGLLTEGINEHYEHLFAVGVDPAKAADLEKHDLWPPKAAVQAYREKAHRLILNMIDQMPEGDITWDSPYWSLPMGLEHDRIHFETSSVLIRQYSLDKVTRPEGWAYAPINLQTVANNYIQIPQRRVQIGKTESFPTYGWDNEYGNLETEVTSFQVSQNLITNAEFLEFVNAGGYSNAEYWSEKAWTWKEKHQVKYPKFWIPQENSFTYRAMFDELEMPLDWPAEVNCYEAQAYCAWKGEGTRLLTEAEYLSMTQGVDLPSGDTLFTEDYNLNMKYGSPSPVGHLAEAKTPEGVNDAYGNVWCWLSNDFYALPGFKVHEYYTNFSELYFDDQHSMLLGGCWATTGTGASRFYRLWFRHYFYQHAGFRIAKDA